MGLSGRGNAITLRDVALKAGVNATTVSVVLNGNRSGTRVSEATRTRILDVASELGYRPNGAARGMKSRRMNTIGVVDTVQNTELNLYFLEILNGILAQASQRGQNTTIFTVSDWIADENKILQFCDGRVDGLVFIAPQFSAAFAKKLGEHVPFVIMHSDDTLPVAAGIEVDDEQGGYLATHYLIEQGHRRILFFGGPEIQAGARLRLAGYRRALRDFGIAFDDSLVTSGEFTMASGLERMTQFLDTYPRETALPTAAFCANDAIASGCMDVLNGRGLRIPQAMSVVGFDDTLAARMTVPPLTTIRQPFSLLGQRSVDLLLLQIEDTDGSEKREVIREVFPVQLIVRGTTAPPPGKPIFL